MNKTCFVIMPISDGGSYQAGHFKRVYDHIIKPACEEAKFTPIRADDIQNTNYIALDILKRILESDMAICDLSSRNPNVLYELGIRQAFDLPVTIIRDSSTSRIFDIQGFRDIEYDESLRVDTVAANKAAIATTLRNTYDSKGKEVNSLISLLKIQPAQISDKVEISNDTNLILSAISDIDSRISQLEQKSLRSNQILSNPPSSVQAETMTRPKQLYLLSLEDARSRKKGDVVYHEKFGRGVVVNVIGEKTANPIMEVNFSDAGPRKIMVQYAKIYRYGDDDDAAV